MDGPDESQMAEPGQSPLPPPIFGPKYLDRPLSTSSARSDFRVLRTGSSGVLGYEGSQGFRHTDFIPTGEMFNAEMVLYTTSALFASVAAACDWIFPLSTLRRQPIGALPLLCPRSLKRLAALVAFAWTTVWLAPCLFRVWPETVQEDGYIFPVMPFLTVWSCISLLVHVTLIMMVKDLKQKGRPSRPNEFRDDIRRFHIVASVSPFEVFRPSNKSGSVCSSSFNHRSHHLF